MWSEWKLRDFAPGEGLRSGAADREVADGAWLAVDVPGDIHRALIAASRIPDPFYGTNETTCAWMEEREWWYRAKWQSAGGPHRLIFHGLDTFATVYVNGIEVGTHQNMFRPARFDVSLVEGSNTVAVRFDPPLERIKGKSLSLWGRNPERTAMRKAQFGYGWDWGPRLPTVGIWRPVEVRALPNSGAEISGVHFYTLEVRDGVAVVGVRVEIERLAISAPVLTSIVLRDPDGQLVNEVDLTIEGDAAMAYIVVDRPKLWWAHELGQPSLYDLSIAAAGTHYRQRVGIRTLSLDQSPDPAERGTRFFRFILNGTPIFAKGADWIPCDSFVGQIPLERYTRLLEQARDANMTMLRIWGGGIYEHDHFYAECDRLGILVWHDFMFACAMYPEDDPEFVAEVDAEARYQVRRLRNHPCLALWCGNNENQWLHERRYWDQPELPHYGARFYDEILPRAVMDLDDRTAYWPGSPYGGSDHNSREEGNVHNWEVWHGNFPRRFGEAPRRENTPEAVTYRRYAEDAGRFISEFGMHAAPVAETLWRVVPPEERYLHSPTLDWHNKDNPKNKGDNLLLATTGLPSDIDEYILYTQIAQAEGLKFGIEHFRRRKPHCSGTLVWQLDDCWPVLSWSLVDYYGFPKPSFYFLRRSYAPVLASFKEADGAVELWLTNDRQHDVLDRATVTLGNFKGDITFQESRDVRISAGESACVWRLGSLSRTPAHYLHVESTGGLFPANRHFFGDFKDLERQPVAPLVKMESAGSHRISVDIRAPAEGYVYFAHVKTLYETTRFSDNYVDLRPGEVRMLTVSDSAHELSPDDLRIGWA